MDVWMLKICARMSIENFMRGKEMKNTNLVFETLKDDARFKECLDKLTDTHGQCASLSFSSFWKAVLEPMSKFYSEIGYWADTYILDRGEVEDFIDTTIVSTFSIMSGTDDSVDDELKARGVYDVKWEQLPAQLYKGVLDPLVSMYSDGLVDLEDEVVVRDFSLILPQIFNLAITYSTKLSSMAIDEYDVIAPLVDVAINNAYCALNVHIRSNTLHPLVSAFAVNSIRGLGTMYEEGVKEMEDCRGELENTEELKRIMESVLDDLKSEATETETDTYID